jgi:hypothetical protein
MKVISGKQKKHLLFMILLSFSVALLLSGCGGGSGGSGINNGLTNVKLNLNMPSGAVASNSIFDSLPFMGTSSAYADTPRVVGSVMVKITGSNTDIQDYHNVTRDQLTLEYNIPSGMTTFLARAYSGSGGNGNALYEGEVTVDLQGTQFDVNIEMILLDIAEALRVLNSGDILGAHDLFRAATIKYDGEGSNEEATANFFYALTRVIVTWLDYESDGENNGLNNIGDFLDAFGCNPNQRDFDVIDPGDYVDLYCPAVIPGSAPDGPEIQAFIANVVRPEVIEAIKNLDRVSESFNIAWTEPEGNTRIESDYGDVLVIKAILKYFMGSIHIYEAYNADINVKSDIDTDTVGDFLARNTNDGNDPFPELVSPSHLDQAKTFFIDALKDIKDGVIKIDEETDSQADDFINLANESDQEMKEILADIDNARTCLDGPCTVDDNKTVGFPDDDTDMDISRFFAGLVDFGSLLPAFNDEGPEGLLPDPTFDGLLVKVDGFAPDALKTTDVNGNGTSDSIEEHIYYVYGRNGTYPPPFVDVNDPQSQGYEFVGVGAANSFLDGTVDFSGTYLYYAIVLDHPVKVFDGPIDYRANIDAIEFIDTSEYKYCCSKEFWTTFDPTKLSDDPDSDGAKMYNSDQIIFQAPDNTTGIRVYGED